MQYVPRARASSLRARTLRHACSLCGCRAPRADCPRCGAGQLSLFDPNAVLPVPDDAETVTLSELAAAAKRERALEEARLERLPALARPVRVGVVGCAKTKRAEPSPCRTLYKSPLFVASLAHAESVCDETYVLSAAHGLLALDQTVAPYERTLREMSKKERIAWGNRVTESVRDRFPRLSLQILILAGLEYAAPVLSAAIRYGWTVETPLARKSIGQRLVWLREHAPPSEKMSKRRRGPS
jgi:hypothetical protein